MVYVDTSVLVALHTNERLTSAVVRWYTGAIEDRLATSDWSGAEFAQAEARTSRLHVTALV